MGIICVFANDTRSSRLLWSGVWLVAGVIFLGGIFVWSSGATKARAEVLPPMDRMEEIAIGLPAMHLSEETVQSLSLVERSYSFAFDPFKRSSSMRLTFSWHIADLSAIPESHARFFTPPDTTLYDGMIPTYRVTLNQQNGEAMTASLELLAIHYRLREDGTKNWQGFSSRPVTRARPIEADVSFDPVIHLEIARDAVHRFRPWHRGREMALDEVRWLDRSGRAGPLPPLRTTVSIAPRGISEEWIEVDGQSALRQTVDVSARYNIEVPADGRVSMRHLSAMHFEQSRTIREPDES